MATFAQQMLSACQTAIAQNLFVVAVGVDGQTVNFESSDQRLKQYQFWKAEVARENGTRPRVARINLGGG